MRRDHLYCRSVVAAPSSWTNRALMPASTRRRAARAGSDQLVESKRRDSLAGNRATGAAAAEGSPIRVLDVASGGGDVPIALAKRASRAGIHVEIEGCDVSPEAVRICPAPGGASAACPSDFSTSTY